MPGPPILPHSLKITYTAFVCAWLPLVVATRGWQNLLWLCDLANLLVLVGLWRESRLILSSQLVATLLIGLVWTIDLLGALLFGAHPFHATVYMLEPSLPLVFRLSSLFHVFVPLLLLYAVTRLGHDRRGWCLQIGVCWIALPLSAWLTEPARNINWIAAPFGIEQAWLPGWAYVLVCMVAYPLILYGPTEAVLRRLLPVAASDR
jgi:hypothetical protein